MKERIKIICLILITLAVVVSTAFWCWSIKIKTEIYIMKTKLETLKDFGEGDTELGIFMKAELQESTQQSIWNLIKY